MTDGDGGEGVTTMSAQPEQPSFEAMFEAIFAEARFRRPLSTDSLTAIDTAETALIDHYFGQTDADSETIEENFFTILRAALASTRFPATSCRR